MKTRDGERSGGNPVDDAVAEFRWSRAKRSVQPLPRDRSKTQHREPTTAPEQAFEVVAAIQNLLRGWLVVGWRAVARRGDHRSRELQAVFRADRGRLVRDPGPMERGVEKISRPVAGKHASSSIRAMRSRGQSKDQAVGIEVAEVRNGATPVHFILKALPLLGRDALAPFDEPRTAPARDDF